MTIYKNIEVKCAEFFNRCKEDTLLLWSIPLASGRIAQKHGNAGKPNVESLAQILNLDIHKFTNFCEQTDFKETIYQLMLAEGVTLPVNDVEEPRYLEQRRELLAWWKKLSTDEKKKLETHKTDIRWSRYFPRTHIAECRTIEFYSDARNEIRIEYNELSSKKLTVKRDRKQAKSVRNSTAVERFESFITNCRNNSELLWDIELCINNPTSSSMTISGKASNAYLRSKLNLSNNNFLNSAKGVELRLKLHELMVAEEVTLPEEQAADLSKLELRRKILVWWKGLDEEDKQNLEIHKNDLRWTKYFNSSCIRAPTLASEDIKQVKADIRAELTDLGILIPEVSKETYRRDCVINNFKEWIEDLRDNPEKLWDIPLQPQIPSTIAEKFGYVDRTYLRKKIDCHKSMMAYGEIKAYMKKLNELMIEHQVVLANNFSNDDNKGSVLFLRKEILSWYRQLDEDQKKEIELFNGFIKRSYYIDSLKDPALHQYVKDSTIQKILKDITTEVMMLQSVQNEDSDRVGGLSSTKDKTRANDKLPKAEIIRKYILLKVKSITDLGKVSFNNEIRYPAVVHLIALSHSPNIDYAINTLSAFEKFLISRDIPPNNNINQCLNMWSLRDFKSFLSYQIGKDLLSTATANTYVSGMRIALRVLKNIKGSEYDFYDVDGFQVIRSSIAYRPYDKLERESIQAALMTDIAELENLISPYVKLKREKADTSDPLVYMRTLFEDEFDSKAMDRGSFNEIPSKLRNQLTKRRVGLYQFYTELGVFSGVVTAEMLIPLILRFAQVTGLNRDSIFDLEIDSFQLRHPLTARPCLTFWKERSDGEKLYHLDIFNADLHWLTSTQSKEIDKLFNLIIALTKRIREHAATEHRTKLFLVGTKVGRPISKSNLTLTYLNFAQKHNITSLSGEPTVITSTRFRPTFVSELLEKDVSIREIQHLLGHKHITTTMGYIDKLDFDRMMRDRTEYSLNRLFEKSVTAFSEKTNDKLKQSKKINQKIIIMQTPLAACKNIFDPPEFIRKLPNYVKGKPCSLYNKCLGCENVLITELNLPELFAMQRSYLYLVGNGEIKNTPYFAAVEENLALLDDILNPNTSDFSSDLLEKAQHESIFIETTLIDPTG